jgi:hypothetical protein
MADHGNTNIVCLRPVWNQTSLTSTQSDQDPSWLLINHITSSETDSYITSSETDREQHGSSSDCADVTVCLDLCWSQTHCLGFVVMRLILLLFISYYKCMNIWKIIRETEIQYVTVHCSYKGRMLLSLIDLRVAAKIKRRALRKYLLSFN